MKWSLLLIHYSKHYETIVFYSISSQLVDIENQLCANLATITLHDPVCVVYNPLSYAVETHQCYVHQYGNSTKHLLFLGMNPGPYGMAQNGVWFVFVVAANNNLL